MKNKEFKFVEYNTPDCYISEVLECGVLCTSDGSTTQPWQQGGEYDLFN